MLYEMLHVRLFRQSDTHESGVGASMHPVIDEAKGLLLYDAHAANQGLFRDRFSIRGDRPINVLRHNLKRTQYLLFDITRRAEL